MSIDHRETDVGDTESTETELATSQLQVAETPPSTTGGSETELLHPQAKTEFRASILWATRAGPTAKHPRRRHARPIKTGLAYQDGMPEKSSRDPTRCWCGDAAMRRCSDAACAGAQNMRRRAKLS
jgi:hypothetical protein